MKNDNYHESVMVHEVLEQLHIKKARKYIDATLGTGGHSLQIAKAGGVVLGIDRDPKMLGIARSRLEAEGIKNWKLEIGNFIDIDRIAIANDFVEVSGILFDLGVSNLHLTDDTRGFSFGNPNDPLDMRLNENSQGVAASDLLNALREDQLISLFETTMERGPARFITKKIIEKREISPFEKVSDLLEICKNLRGKPGISPATLPFLALRIGVNSELDNLESVLPKAYSLIEPGGYLVVISFHSGEDKIVKDFYKKYGGGELIYPNEMEVNLNPKARSAKLRVLKKTN